jgi:hypothetical protein
MTESSETKSGQEPLEPDTKAEEASSKPTYMVLYAPVPEDPDHDPRYREAGYREAHDGDQACRLAREADDEHGAAIRKAAGERGVYLRGISARTWKADAKPAKVKTTTTWE